MSSCGPMVDEVQRCLKYLQYEFAGFLSVPREADCVSFEYKGEDGATI